jgi:hypothetical protein
MAAELLLGADHLEHGSGIRGLLERLAEFGSVKEFGDVGECVEVLLKLALRDEEKHDEIDRLIVEGVELNSFAGAAEGADDFADKIGGGVGNADPETDSGAHRGFSLFDDGSDGVLVFLFDFAGGNEVIDELINDFPAILCLEVGEDLLRAENIA